MSQPEGVAPILLDSHRKDSDTNTRILTALARSNMKRFAKSPGRTLRQIFSSSQVLHVSFPVRRGEPTTHTKTNLVLRKEPTHCCFFKRPNAPMKPLRPIALLNNSSDVS